MGQVRRLLRLRGIGIRSSWLFVMEFFGWRRIRNRRELAGLAGLTPVEMLGYVDFPNITAQPYPLTLAPYGFMWLELHAPETPSELKAERQQIEEAIVSLERLALGRGRRRGRPPSWMSEVTTTKRRGRPPGSKNKVQSVVTAPIISATG